MSVILTSAQMRALEREAMHSGAVTGLALMERAGAGCVRAILARWPELAATAAEVAVLCGPGNNGGDGFVIARLLRERGCTVRVFFYGDADRLPPDARQNYDRWRDLGPAEPLESDAVFAARPALWVDALFGIGLSRDVPEAIYRALDYTDTVRVPMVCVDMPSWFDSDSGRHLGRGHGRVFDLVITFAAPKPGHFIGAAPEFIRALEVVDIGLDANTVPDATDLVTSAGLSLLDKGAAGHALHKFSHGHALVISGGPGQTGAARLAARGALRIGAGLVTVAGPAEARAELGAQLTAVMTRALETAEDLRAALRDSRISALCLGPGCGVDRAGRLLAALLASGRACVLDADALTALAADKSPRLHAACVLTPHDGEFARLFPDLAAALKADDITRLEAARQAAARCGATVLLKGPATVIASADGRTSVHAALYEQAAPWLATAGSGDVLAGFLSGLLARGLHPHDAAEAAVWLHAACARRFGPGLIAEDLPDMLPAVFRDLGF